MVDDPRCHRPEPVCSRRQWLASAGGGFGAIALSALMAEETAAEPASRSVNNPSPLAPKQPHDKSRAKACIFLFMEGGPSHLDTFDPKPTLNKLAGKPLPESFGPIVTSMGEVRSPLLASPRKWKRHGQSGLWVSELLPYVAEMADDLAVIRSCVTDGINHSGGVCEMNTGTVLGGRPCLGSWVTYGLGSENQNLPAFVVMQDAQAQVVNGSRNWSAG